MQKKINKTKNNKNDQNQICQKIQNIVHITEAPRHNVMTMTQWHHFVYWKSLHFRLIGKYPKKNPTYSTSYLLWIYENHICELWIWRIENETNLVHARFEPMTSEILVQCSTNWANNPTKSWSSCWFVINPWGDE